MDPWLLPACRAEINRREEHEDIDNEEDDATTDKEDDYMCDGSASRYVTKRPNMMMIAWWSDNGYVYLVGMGICVCVYGYLVCVYRV